MKYPARNLILCILAFVMSASMVAADYLGSLREAATAIEAGAYTQAGQALEQALVANESDPLAHLALAVLYLHVGKLDDSAREFRTVISAEPGHWQAHYGLALIATLKGDKSTAREEMVVVRELSKDDPQAVAFDLYRAYLSGSTAVPPAVDDALARQVSALVAAKAGHRDAARSALLDLLRAPAPTGFEENRAPVATFSLAAPIAIPHGRLDWSPARKEQAPEVSGVVYLNADASNADGVHFVSLYVDGSFIGMSNYRPFSFNWNTARHPNGMHQIRIDGKDQSGNVISTKSTWVRVNNANAVSTAHVSGPEADELNRRLWDCLRLSESRRLAHYELAGILLAEGERDTAVHHLEYALAYRPDYGDAARLLDKLQGHPKECREIRSGAPGQKRVAITFDDGPNQRTAGLLDVLAELKMPATFFLVGFRAEAQPDLVKAIESAGHDIQNHSYTHVNLTTVSAYDIEEQLCKTNAVIRAITGNAPRFFRPPGGNFNGTVKKAAAKHGMSGIFWTVNCGPFEGGDPGMLADFVIENISDGGIVLMHNGEPATVSALPSIAERLRAQGYQFVTVSELLAAK